MSCSLIESAGMTLRTSAVFFHAQGGGYQILFHPTVLSNQPSSHFVGKGQRFKVSEIETITPWWKVQNDQNKQPADNFYCYDFATNLFQTEV